MDKIVYKEYINHHEDIFKNKSDDTKLIHCGQEPDYVNGSVVPNISLATTYSQHSPGDPFGEFDYSRCGNPTREHLERLITAIENGKHSIVFASGCGATNTIINLVKSGEEVICIDDVYGGTQRIFRKISSITHGVEYIFDPLTDLEKFKKLLTEKTRMIWIESNTNPTLKIVDIKSIIKIAKEFNQNILVVVDNTFITPYYFKSLDIGADIAYESCTKYLSGHSDVVMGSLTVNNTELYERLYFIAKSIGANPSPFDCYMMIRGMKTLHLRMEKHTENALKIAEFLESNDKIEKVMYPGLKSNEYHENLKKISRSAGGVVSFILKTDLEGTVKFVKSLKIITLAESLGAIESLINHPAKMTHFSLPPEVRKELGISDSFLRISVGCENIDDLIEDLKNALYIL